MWRSERRFGPVWRNAPRRFAAALALCGAALATAGCAVVPPMPAGSSSEASVREWNGRFWVMVEAALPGGNQDTIAGRFALSARGAPGARALELELVSPFGQTLATGRREPDGRAMLTLSDGRTLRAPSLDALLEQALGWPLPIERLPDWLDDRFETVITRDAAGRVATAQDSGWRIEREPRRWTLRRPHEGTQLRVGLVLDR